MAADEFVPSSQFWKGVMRITSRGMGRGNGVVGESRPGIFRATWAFLRKGGGKKRNNLDVTYETSSDITTTTISNDDSSNRRDRTRRGGVGGTLHFETLFPPRRTAAAKAAAAVTEPGKKTKAGLFGTSRRSRSSSACHVTMGTSSAKQRAAGSVGRRLAPAGASSVGAGEGSQTSLANDSVLRAVSGVSMPSLDEVYHAVPRRSKVEISIPEKMFIRYIEEVNPDGLEVQPSSPLLGPVRMRHHTSARNGEGFKKTLVLDLDETLISSRRTPCYCDYEIVYNKNTTFYVRLRPGLHKFLEEMSALYELVVWTASGKTYADAIIDLLDVNGEFFSQRLYRESCVRLKDVRFKDVYIKDLRRLGRPMDAVVLVDNYVYSFGLTLDNGVPIFPWTGDEEDDESGLMMASSLLKRAANVPDIRVPLITAFNLYTSIHGKRPPLAPI